MGNSLRCCLSCVLPFGSLDLIRIVHLNGKIEQLKPPMTAGEILNRYPNQILAMPCTESDCKKRRMIVLSARSELKRGSIYFLIPA
ncbi:hypothetical protein M569_12303, partial [Genlisea aurea]